MLSVVNLLNMRRARVRFTGLFGEVGADEGLHEVHFNEHIKEIGAFIFTVPMMVLFLCSRESLSQIFLNPTIIFVLCE